VPVRLAAKQAKKIAKLAELEGVDRSTVMRQLIDIALDSPQVTLLMRRPGTKGRSAVERVIRVVAANERVKVTQSAVCAPRKSKRKRWLRMLITTCALSSRHEPGQ
jgi:hypothetical protein